MFWAARGGELEHLFLLRIKTGAQVRSHDGAEIIAAAEHPVADASHEIIHKVAQTARNYAQHFCESFPTAAQRSQNIKRSVRAHEQGAVSGEDDEAVRQAGETVRRHARLDGFALQWSKPEGTSGAVVFKNELHGAVAQAAVAIVENIFGFLREREHRKA